MELAVEIRKNKPFRKFRVGAGREIEISHTADVKLEPNEQVTFVTDSETEFDFVRKSWGYYATPSTNGRLINHRLRAALISNVQNMLYVMVCEVGHEKEFEEYLSTEHQTLLTWLDTEHAVNQLKTCFTNQ